jgi:hypothetical protein
VNVKTENTLRWVYLAVAIAMLTAWFASVTTRMQLVGTGRRPLVLVGGQFEQLQTGDYVLSVGGASFNGTPPTAAGDIEVTTINGAAPGGGGLSGTVNRLVKFGTTTTGINSSVSDDGTTVTTAEALVSGNVNAQNYVNGPTLQTFVIPSTSYAFGEINRMEISGVVPAYPADLFVQVIRNTATADTTTHTQRSGGLAVETYGTRTAGSLDMYNIAIECLAQNAQINNCLEALNGDIVADNGDIYTNTGSIHSGAGGMSTTGILYAQGSGLQGLYLNNNPTDNIYSTDQTTRFNVHYAAAGASLRVTNDANTINLIVDGPITNVATVWTSGTGVPAISCAIGDLFTRTNGAAGSTLYSCTALNTWTAVGGTSGTVTSVATGTGLTGGTITTTGTLSLNINGGSTQTCSAGNFVSALSATGIATCTVPAGGGTITGSGTANTTTKFTGASAIGNAWALDDGTTWGVTSKFTITEASGNTAVNGTLTADAGNRVIDAVGTGLTQTANSVAITATGVGAGSCTSCNLTYNASGQITVAANGGGGGTTSGAGTNNTMAKFSGASSIVNSLLTDDASTLKYNSTAFTATTTGGVGAAAYFQAPTIYGGTGNGKVLLHGGSTSLDFDAATNATATGFINATGYAEGITQFRDVEIDDGKGTGATHAIGYFNGSSHLVTLGIGNTAPSTTGALAIVENAGNVAFAVRDTMNSIEIEARTSSLGNAVVGTFTNHVLNLVTNNLSGISIGTNQNSTFAGLIIGQSGTPSTPTSCGTSPSILGSDNGGIITTGTGAPTSCTVAFAHTWPNAPACTLTSNNNGNVFFFSALSTTGFTVTTAAGAGLTSVKINFNCWGY